MRNRFYLLPLLIAIVFGSWSDRQMVRGQEPADPAPAAEASSPPENEASAVAQPVPGLSGTEVFNRMLPSTCWLRLEYMNGNVPWERMGTGWVYDIDQRLVVTNEHVVHGLDTLTAHFPQEVDGELEHDPTWYRTKASKFAGRVITRSTALDLALVQLDALPENAVALKLAEKSPLPGERVFALAGLPKGSEGLWIMTTGEVRQVYRRSHANGHYARVVETQLPTNGGNSGGAVVNDRLDVVAVVEGERTDARLVSMFIDVNEVRGFLEESVPLVEPKTASDFETRASKRFDEARYDRAIEDYTAALKIDPKLASAMTNRGWAYLQKEDYETAKADFNAAVKIDPEMRGAYAGRGTCYRELGDYKTAIRDLTEAIRRDSNDPDAYERRAKCYARQDQHEAALKDRNRALELAPDDIDYLAGRGQTYRALRQFNEAQKDFEKVISLDPSRAAPYYELGYVYFDKEAYNQACFFFNMAVERDKTAAEYFYMHGMSNFRAKFYDAAILDLNNAIARKPDRSHYYWYLGIAHWNLDHYPESAQAYTNYIRVLPDEPKGYEERADVYDMMERPDLAAADRATAERLKREKK